MKNLRMEVLPKCDFCKKVDAVYDAPTDHGSWAYMCTECSKSKANPGLLSIGNRIVQHTPAVPKESGKIFLGKEASTMEEVVIDSVRMVECPECAMSRSVEPDADYVFTCDGCGVKVRCKQIM